MIVQVEFTAFTRAIEHVKDQQQLVKTEPSRNFIQEGKHRQARLTLHSWQQSEPAGRNRRKNLLVG